MLQSWLDEFERLQAGLEHLARIGSARDEEAVPSAGHRNEQLGDGELPLLGESSLASAVFFDFGVFASVAGATLLALTTLGRLEAR